MSEGNEISRRYEGPGDNTPYVPSWLVEEDQPKPSWAEIGAMNQEIAQLRQQLSTEREKYQRLSDSETEQWEAYGARLIAALQNALNKLDTIIFDERSTLAEVRKILLGGLGQQSEEVDGFIPCPRCGRDLESAQCMCARTEDFPS